MIQAVKDDLFRYVPGEYTFSKLLTGLRAPGFRFLFLFRLAQSARYQFTRSLVRFVLKRYVYKYGFQIPYQTKIGSGFHISHFGYILINPDTVLGLNCNINPGVIIGQTNRGSRKGSPTIGDRVWIGANAIIVGKISIGNNVLVAPGAYINFDVPDNSLVFGNPGQVRQALDATAGYVCNIPAPR